MTQPHKLFGSQRWRERIALIAALAFLSAGIAFVSHVDKPQMAGTATDICAFCLHLGHIGTAPEIDVQAASPVPAFTPIELLPGAPSLAPVHRYFSRGPPA